MRRVKAGEEAALGALMAEWEVAVKRLVARLVHNASEAEEIAQETFVRVWLQRGRFRDEAAFRPWLFAIAVNLARNRLRWWRRRPAVSLEDWMEGDSVDDRSGSDRPGREMERLERAEAIRAAVAALPGELRETLALFQYEELSHQEIAEALGCTPKAVETRLYRARARLREMLKGILNDTGKQ